MNQGRAAFFAFFYLMVGSTAHSDPVIEEPYTLEETKPCHCNYDLMKPYRERRGSWSDIVSFGYSRYQPADYDPDFTVNTTLKDYYGDPETPLVEISYRIKKNLPGFAVGIDFGGGYYQNKGSNNSTLNVIPARVGGYLALDGIFHEPYLVPYAEAGGYTVFYDETSGGQKVSGRTSPAMYYAFGTLIQINWLDPSTAREALVEDGLENAFVFLEMRAFLAPQTKVPDFSAPLQIGGGFSLEF